MARNMSSLVQLCVVTARSNLRYIDDVGDVAVELLNEFWPHCMLEQLTIIENSAKIQGRDLSDVTNDMWKKFYGIQFGEKSFNARLVEIKDSRVELKWKLLFEVKEAEIKKREERQNKAAEKLKERYQDANAEKNGRGIKFTNKVPNVGKKRNFWSAGSSSVKVSNIKSNILKKAKLDTLYGIEAKNKAAMKKMDLRRDTFTHQSSSRSTQSAGNLPGKGPATSASHKNMLHGEQERRARA